jgi:anti-sigma-K factor RskA
MNLHNYPGLLDRLAAEYALGTLRGGSRRRLEALAQRDSVVRRSLALWRVRIESMAELTPGQRPPESVWRAIETRLGLATLLRPPATRATPAQPGAGARVARWFESLDFWRGWAIAATATAVVALGVALRPVLLPEHGAAPAQTAQNAPRIAYVAVLHDQSAQQQSTLLVTWDDAHNTMTLKRLADYPLRSNQALELWGLPAQGNPVSLGVIHADASYSVQLQQRPQNYPVLAVTVEPSGGSPNPNGPTGPVVYTGKLVPTT